MKLLDPRVIDVVGEVHRYNVSHRPVLDRLEEGTPWSKEHIESLLSHSAESFIRDLASLPIYELGHRCEKPIHCAVDALLDARCFKTLWDGHWRGEKVKFLVPRCVDASNGFPTTCAPAVAALIAEEHGVEVGDDHEVFKRFDLWMHPQHMIRDQILPVVHTSRTQYWLKHELEEFCEQTKTELELTGRKFADTLLSEGFKNTSGEVCVICGCRGYVEYTVSPKPDSPVKFKYSLHLGKCYTEFSKAVTTYREAAQSALRQLEEMGVTNGKRKSKVRRRTVRG
jgi:hypothetical protein